MRVVVYTADCGGHDEVWRPVEQDVPDYWDVGFIRLQDSYHFPPGGHGWENTLLTGGENPGPLHDRLLARWAKCHPHLLFPETDVTIWVDACLEITSPTFVLDAANQVFPHAPYAAFQHPDRDNIRDEVEAADTLAKYDGNRHAEMVEAYEATLAHRILDLWAMTVLVRRNHWTARAIDHLVWSETLRWSTPEVTALDQLILPWVSEILSVDLQPLDAPPDLASLWDNAWFVRHPHRRES